MKGTIKPDHMPLNKYTLQIIGLIPITMTKVTGVEDELEVIEMPDRTKASGGFRKATEFSAMVPLHHTAEQAALELWFRESQDPISPGYKKACTLTHESLSGDNTRTFSLAGVFPMKRKLPDLEVKNEGELAEVEWTFSADDVLPL